MWTGSLHCCVTGESQYVTIFSTSPNYRICSLQCRRESFQCVAWRCSSCFVCLGRKRLGFSRVAVSSRVVHLGGPHVTRMVLRSYQLVYTFRHSTRQSGVNVFCSIRNSRTRWEKYTCDSTSVMQTMQWIWIKFGAGGLEYKLLG
jgi:hypothetical protein